MMLAAGAGSLQAVKALAARGADVNAGEPRLGQTPLMWAAAEGHRDVILGLVELGAKVDATSKSGFTPLSWIAKTCLVQRQNEAWLENPEWKQRLFDAEEKVHGVPEWFAAAGHLQVAARRE